MWVGWFSWRQQQQRRYWLVTIADFAICDWNGYDCWLFYRGNYKYGPRVCFFYNPWLIGRFCNPEDGHAMFRDDERVRLTTLKGRVNPGSYHNAPIHVKKKKKSVAVLHAHR
jgi:hypothetical protein